MEPTFEIEDALCELGKISNNLESHGDEQVVVFAIPVTGAMLPVAMTAEDPVNAIAGDPYFTRSVFNDKAGFYEPMKWVREAIPFPENYDKATVRIELPGDEVLDFIDSRIGKISLMPTAGGLIEVCFQIQIKPDLERESQLLLEYQGHKNIKITVLDAKIALKKGGKQQQLPLQQPKETAIATPEDGDAKRNAEIEGKILAELKKLASVGAKVPSDEDFALFKAYKAQHEEWGSLAVVLRDLNIADQFIHECIDVAGEERDDLAVRLGKVLLHLGHEARSLIAKIP